MTDDIFEDDTHVFIVRTWTEHREIAGALPQWRGTIEHVPSGKRQSLKKVKEICQFIQPYLSERMMPSKSHWRFMPWLDRRLRLVKKKNNPDE